MLMLSITIFPFAAGTIHHFRTCKSDDYKSHFQKTLLICCCSFALLFTLLIFFFFFLFDSKFLPCCAITCLHLLFNWPFLENPFWYKRYKLFKVLVCNNCVDCWLCCYTILIEANIWTRYEMLHNICTITTIKCCDAFNTRTFIECSLFTVHCSQTPSFTFTVSHPCWFCLLSCLFSLCFDL